MFHFTPFSHQPFSIRYLPGVNSMDTYPAPIVDTAPELPHNMPEHGVNDLSAASGSYDGTTWITWTATRAATTPDTKFDLSYR